MKYWDRIAKREKRILAIDRELKKLYKAWSSMGYKKLDKPIKDGWIKHLALREDVARRKDAHVFQQIIDRCGAEVWGSTKQRADQNWQRYHSGHKSDQVKDGLELLFREKLVGMSKKARMYFDGYDWKWMIHRGYVKRYYCKVPRHYFVTTYSRSYIRAIQIRDSELERQIAELEAENFRDELYRHWMKSAGKWNTVPYNYHRRKRKRVKDQLKKYDEIDFDYWANKLVSPY
ncbi:MAG: hypothetical protein AAFQ94_05515 [Bacteroidota bacterium]